MSVVLGAYLIVAILEQIIWIPIFWKVRSWLAIILLTACFTSFAVLLIASPSFFSSLLAVVAVYRIVNLYRLYIGRMREEYLKQVTWRTSRWLFAVTVGLTLFWFF